MQLSQLNRKQKRVLFISIGLIILTILCPPWNRASQTQMVQQGIYGNKTHGIGLPLFQEGFEGYHWLFTAPTGGSSYEQDYDYGYNIFKAQSSGYSIAFGVLVLQWLLIALISFGLIYRYKNAHSRPIKTKKSKKQPFQTIYPNTEKSLIPLCPHCGGGKSYRSQEAYWCPDCGKLSSAIEDNKEPANLKKGPANSQLKLFIILGFIAIIFVLIIIFKPSPKYQPYSYQRMPPHKINKEEQEHRLPVSNPETHEDNKSKKEHPLEKALRENGIIARQLPRQSPMNKSPSTIINKKPSQHRHQTNIKNAKDQGILELKGDTILVPLEER